MPKNEIQNLALRRALFFPSAEIYAEKIAGFFDFGPIGARIRRKIIEVWRKKLVEKENFHEIHGAQILPEKVFIASGHLANFNDPVIQCKKCHSIFRADQLIQETIKIVVPESISTNELDALIKKHKINCLKCNSNDFTETKQFNMMLALDIGATGKQKAFLRPETCQNIFLNFKRIYALEQKLPLGIAQAGSSFRNEIAPRNTLLRERELGQMEIEIFFNPKKINEIEENKWNEVKDYKLRMLLLKEGLTEKSCDELVKKKIVSGKLIAYYLARLQQLYEAFGIPVEKMRFRELEEEARAFYAKETFDFEVETDLGFIELVACNYRTDHDLKGHSKESSVDLSVIEDKEKFIPHVFELSAGIDRTFYVVLDNSFRKEKRGSEERIYLNLPITLSPFDAAVFPLVKKDGLKEKALEVFEFLSSYGFSLIFEENASIGRRYARIDEIGVKYAITIDYDTLKDETITLRERNSMQQKRIKIKELPEFLWLLLNEKKDF